MTDNTIEITVKASSGMGKSTVASHIAKALYDMGFYVVVDDSDEIGPKFLEQERLDSVLNKNLTISISTEHKPIISLTVSI
jgi:adenylylsulfate kinase-like enzyme